MWKVTYKIEGSDGKLYQNEKRVKSLADFHLFNNALHHGAAMVVAVRDPRGRMHSMARDGRRVL